MGKWLCGKCAKGNGGGCIGICPGKSVKNCSHCTWSAGRYVTGTVRTRRGSSDVRY